MLGNISQMMLNIIDSAMVGQLSYKHLAASALVNNMVGIPYVMCIGFTLAVSVLTAQLKGQNKKADCGNLLNNSVLLIGIIVTVLITVLHSTSGIIHHLKQDPEVAILGKPFLSWILWSIIPMTIFLCMKQFCDALNHTRFPLFLSLFSILLNTGLNYLLIYGNLGFPKLELEGSGIATFTTRMVIAIALGFYILKHSTFKVYNITNRIINSEKIKHILKLAIPSSLQHSSEVAAFVILGILSGWFGAKQQAAHQIAMSIAALTFMITMGISAAGSIKVGESFGKEDFVRMRNFGINALVLSGIYGLLCGIVFIVFCNQLPLLFTKEQEVIYYASYLMLFAAAFQISDSIQGVGIGVLRGAQDVKRPTIYTTIIYWFVGIPAGYICAVYLKWEVFGIWVGFIVCLSIMAVLLIQRFLMLTKAHAQSKFF